MKNSWRLILVASAAVATAVAAEPRKHPEVEYGRPFPWVACSDRASDQVENAAKTIAELIGAKLEVQKRERNPICCVWVEVTGWNPTPGQGGYVIINQPGGSLISATNEEQLLKAVERFKAASRKGAEGVEVPTGIMTNFRIVPPEVEAR